MGLVMKSFMPACQAARAVLGEGVGRHRHDRHRLPARQLADAAGGLGAVHAGHLHVHQDQVEGLLRHLLHGLQPVGRRRHLQAHVSQQVLHHLAVDGFVFDQQHLPASVALLQRCLGAGARLHRSRQLGLWRTAQPHGEPEQAALPRLAGGAGVAAHQLRQRARQRQPQPGAAVAARGGGVGLLEGREQLRSGRLRGDAHAGVLHLEAQAHLSGRRR
jgi:hypothetical protein